MTKQQIKLIISIFIAVVCVILALESTGAEALKHTRAFHRPHRSHKVAVGFDSDSHSHPHHEIERKPLDSTTRIEETIEFVGFRAYDLVLSKSESESESTTRNVFVSALFVQSIESVDEPKEEADHEHEHENEDHRPPPHHHHKSKRIVMCATTDVDGDLHNMFKYDNNDDESTYPDGKLYCNSTKYGNALSLSFTTTLPEENWVVYMAFFGLKEPVSYELRICEAEEDVAEECIRGCDSACTYGTCSPLEGACVCEEGFYLADCSKAIPDPEEDDSRHPHPHPHPHYSYSSGYYGYSSTYSWEIFVAIVNIALQLAFYVGLPILGCFIIASICMFCAHVYLGIKKKHSPQSRGMVHQPPPPPPPPYIISPQPQPLLAQQQLPLPPQPQPLLPTYGTQYRQGYVAVASQEREPLLAPINQQRGDAEALVQAPTTTTPPPPPPPPPPTQTVIPVTIPATQGQTVIPVTIPTTPTDGNSVIYIVLNRQV